MVHSFFLLTLSVLFILDLVQSGSPVFDDTFEFKKINEGLIASVLCNATNDSPIKYKWYNNFGEEVSDKVNRDVKTSETLDGSLLIFDPVNSSHEGVYTCTAENQHGLVSKVYQIVVNSVVTENETLTVSVKVLNVTDSTVELFVQAASPVQSYKVKYFEELKKNISILEFEGPNLVLDGLIPSGLYTFQFQAILSNNRTSDWSMAYEVVLLPYTPEVILRSLSGYSIQIEWSKKLDDFNRKTIDGYSVSHGHLQRAHYDSWEPIKCFVNIEIPVSCFGASYTIADLSKGYNEIRLRAHTKAGYGKPFVTKVYVA